MINHNGYNGEINKIFCYCTGWNYLFLRIWFKIQDRYCSLYLLHITLVCPKYKNNLFYRTSWSCKNKTLNSNCNRFLSKKQEYHSHYTHTTAHHKCTETVKNVHFFESQSFFGEQEKNLDTFVHLLKVCLSRIRFMEPLELECSQE